MRGGRQEVAAVRPGRDIRVPARPLLGGLRQPGEAAVEDHYGPYGGRAQQIPDLGVGDGVDGAVRRGGAGREIQLVPGAQQTVAGEAEDDDSALRPVDGRLHRREYVRRADGIGDQLDLILGHAAHRVQRRGETGGGACGTRQIRQP